MTPVPCRVFGNSAENSAQSEGDEKYKTELCKNWIQYRYCSYGNKCRFAHGPDDLVNKQLYNPRYKSKKCEAFHNTSYCPYGPRCNFIHEDGYNYDNRILYYTYLLDVQNKSNVYKYKLVKFLEGIFSSSENVGIDTQDELFETFVQYIKNGEYCKRLPVFIKLANNESQNDLNKDNELNNLRVKILLREIFGKIGRASCRERVSSPV